MREAFRCDCGPSPRREPLSRMEVVAQLFFYARRFSVGAFQGRREFLRRPEILVVASFQSFPFFAVFLAHNRRNISARRSLRQALRVPAASPSVALLSAFPLAFALSSIGSPKVPSDARAKAA